MLLLASGIILPNHYSNRVSAASHTNTTGETASLSVSGNINLDLIPTTIGTVGIGKTDVLVTTDSTNGYQILMSGSIGEDGYAPLYGPTLSGEATLNRISSVSSEHVALAANTWGYTLADESNPHQTATQLNSYIGNQYAHGELDTLLFSPIVASPTSPATIATINSPTPTTGDTTSVYVGVKAGGNDAILMKGNYSNSLVFTTIVEPNYHDDGALTITATNSSGITNTVSSTTAGVGGDNLSNSTVSGDIGQTITLVTDYTNAASAVSSSNVHVYLFTGTSWNGSSIANATNPTTPVAECTNITIDPNNTGDNGTSITHPLALTCSVPTSYASTLTNNATYGVAVEVLDTTNTGTNAGQHYFSYWMPGVYTITTKYSYTINYNANGGSGTIASQTGEVYIGSTQSITTSASTGFSRTYYNLLGWNTDSSAAAATLTPASSAVTVSQSNSTITLYAIWQRQTYSYTINYNANNGSGAPSADTGTGNVGEAKSVTLSSTVPTRTNYSFLGWSESSTATSASYAAGASYPLGTPTSTSAITKTLYAVWKSNTWTATVNYDANGGSGAPAATEVSGITTSTSSQSVTLDSATTPTRSGYTFIGWASAASVPHTTYANGASLTVQQSSPTITVYAEWIANSATSGGNMQNASCSSLTHGTLYSMTDTRTSKSYLVAKLADGNCWMLQNLYLPGGKTLSNTDSNLTTKTSYTLPASNQTASGRWNSNTNTTGYFYAGTHKDATVDSAYNAANDEKNTGSYFSYVVVTAGLAPTTASGTASDSVCPKNWKLPTGGASGQFQALYTAYSSNYDNMKSAFKAAYTSACYSGGCPTSYDRARWWSSTIDSAVGSYYMNMYISSSFYPQSVGDKYAGFSVRCVFAG